MLTSCFVNHLHKKYLWPIGTVIVLSCHFVDVAWSSVFLIAFRLRSVHDAWWGKRNIATIRDELQTSTLIWREVVGQFRVPTLVICHIQHRASRACSDVKQWSRCFEFLFFSLKHHLSWRKKLSRRLQDRIRFNINLDQFSWCRGGMRYCTLTEISLLQLHCLALAAVQMIYSWHNVLVTTIETWMWGGKSSISRTVS